MQIMMTSRPTAGAAGSRDAADVPRPVGRFAPTPSGRMHLGNVFAALVAWLSVRSAGGRMVLRIEDLDGRARGGPWEALLLEDLRWLGLDWDEGPWRQRDRVECYEAALRTLRDRGRVYPCFCTRAERHAASAPHASDGMPVYPGTCRDLSAAEVAQLRARRRPALRVRVPDAQDPAGTISFVDRAFGARRAVLAERCGDILVRRSDGVIAYQLAAAVDDGEMGITEVVRGRDLLGSVAPQRYLQTLLGFAPPSCGHVPLVVAPDGRRLSKRDRDLDMGQLRARFERPERLLGWLAAQAGLVRDAAPRSASQLVDSFSWDCLRAHRRDIEVDSGKLG